MNKGEKRIVVNTSPWIALSICGQNHLLKILYDEIYFAEVSAKAAKTVTVVPGVHADFSAEGKLIGIEVIDASEIMGKKIEFALPEVPRPEMKVASK